MNTISESPCSSSLVRRLENYLLVARWGVIIVAAAILSFEGFSGGTLLPIAPLWAVFIFLNVFLSLYIWQKEPFLNKKSTLVISLDTIQITLNLARFTLHRGIRSVLYHRRSSCFALALGWRDAPNSSRPFTVTRQQGRSPRKRAGEKFNETPIQT